MAATVISEQSAVFGKISQSFYPNTMETGLRSIDSGVTAKTTAAESRSQPRVKNTMTPPNAHQNGLTTPLPQAGFGIGVSESPYGDSPDHLTFDEMREMPMNMALGFDTED